MASKKSGKGFRTHDPACTHTRCAAWHYDPPAEDAERSAYELPQRETLAPCENVALKVHCACKTVDLWQIDATFKQILTDVQRDVHVGSNRPYAAGIPETSPIHRLTWIWVNRHCAGRTHEQKCFEPSTAKQTLLWPLHACCRNSQMRCHETVPQSSSTAEVNC